MTPIQKIKRAILLICQQWALKYETNPDPAPVITAENVDALWDAADENDTDQLQDATNEFRESGEPTKLKCDYSRHYESMAVAKKMDDGTWVGWTYWYGGGKHGDPGSIDWLERAYDVDVTEEEKLVVVRTFAAATAEGQP